MFVADFPDYLFNNIFQGDNSRGRTVLIDNDSHLHTVTQFNQERQKPNGLGNLVGRNRN